MEDCQHIIYQHSQLTHQLVIRSSDVVKDDLWAGPLQATRFSPSSGWAAVGNHFFPFFEGGQPFLCWGGEGKQR